MTSRPDKRGVSRSSRTLGAGCGGRVGVAAWLIHADERPDAYGEIVWSWGPGAGAKVVGLDESDERRGQERRSPGRSRISRQTIAQGRPDVRLTCGSAACFFAARGPWVRSAPGLPCALCLEEADPTAKLGRKSRRGN